MGNRLILALPGRLMEIRPMGDVIAIAIVERETGKVVHSVECRRGTDPDRIERGILINMDHDRFYTLPITESPTEGKADG